MSKDNLGDRMKGYEKVSKGKLIRRTPVIIRIDGKSFHTYVKQDGIDKPFCDILHGAMACTTNKLVKEMQNAVVGYTQSDEISILLNDWKTLTSEQWMGGGIQKIASVAASMATAFFNDTKPDHWYPAIFDARVFNVPREDVTNYFVWRQQDATRNSVQMLARAHFSHKSLHGLNNSQLQDKLMLEKDINWNDLHEWKKRGVALIGSDRVENPTPIFTKNRDFINDLLAVEDD